MAIQILSQAASRPKYPLSVKVIELEVPVIGALPMTMNRKVDLRHSNKK